MFSEGKYRCAPMIVLVTHITIIIHSTCTISISISLYQTPYMYGTTDGTVLTTTFLKCLSCRSNNTVFLVDVLEVLKVVSQAGKEHSALVSCTEVLILTFLRFAYF